MTVREWFHGSIQWQENKKMKSTQQMRYNVSEWKQLSRDKVRANLMNILLYSPALLHSSIFVLLGTRLPRGMPGSSTMHRHVSPITKIVTSEAKLILHVSGVAYSCNETKFRAQSPSWNCSNPLCNYPRVGRENCKIAIPKIAEEFHIPEDMTTIG